jgi:hypothetical protein
MSSSDLFVAGFPHGTPNGYQKGCRSNGVCPAKLETGQSCKEANIRVSRDAAYRALVQSGADVEVLAQPEVDAAPVKVPGARPAPHQAVPKMLRDKPARPVVPRKPMPDHGTVARYARGCREDCPGNEQGITCRQASAEYSRDYKARRKADREGTTAAAASQPAEGDDLATAPTSPESREAPSSRRHPKRSPTSCAPSPSGTNASPLQPPRSGQRRSLLICMRTVRALQPPSSQTSPSPSTPSPKRHGARRRW